MYLLLSSSKVNVTDPSLSPCLNKSFPKMFPLSNPNSANSIDSNIVLFPLPISPERRVFLKEIMRKNKKLSSIIRKVIKDE